MDKEERILASDTLMNRLLDEVTNYACETGCDDYRYILSSLIGLFIVLSKKHGLSEEFACKMVRVGYKAAEKDIHKQT